MKHSRILLFAVPLVVGLAATGPSHAEQKNNECKRGGTNFQNPCRPPHKGGTDCNMLPPEANRVRETGQIDSARVFANYEMLVSSPKKGKGKHAKSRENCPKTPQDKPSPTPSPSTMS